MANNPKPLAEMPPTILDAEGQDQEQVRLVNMLRHWMGSMVVGPRIMALGICPTREEIHELRMSRLHKIAAAYYVRKILLNKEARKLVVALVHAKNPEVPYADVVGGLKQLCAEMQPLASAYKSKLIIATANEFELRQGASKAN